MKLYNPATTSLLALAISAGAALAHEVLLHGHLDGAQAGTDSDAIGTIEMQTDEHSGAFDVLSFDVEGIFEDDLDRSHGPNLSAFHVHLMEEAPARHGGIVIDLGWYVDAGFGTLTPTATGFHVEISGILTEIQGAYDMTGTTGLTPEDVMHHLNEGLGLVVVHTLDYPEGEIAGMLVPEQETPTVESSWGTLKVVYAEK
jgi:hypothetical protein